MAIAVQFVDGQSTTTDTTSVVTLTTPPTVGNMLIVAIGRFVTLPGAGELVDNRGNTYTLDRAQHTSHIASTGVAIYRATILVNTAPFTLTYTTGLTGQNGWVSMGYLSVSDLPVSPVDQHIGQGCQTSCTTLNAGVLNPMFSPSIIVGVTSKRAHDGDAPVTPPTGWTEVFKQNDNSSFVGIHVAYKLLPDLQLLNVIWNSNALAATTYDACAVNYKPLGTSNSGGMPGDVARRVKVGSGTWVSDRAK